jgi:hypothetical protein
MILVLSLILGQVSIRVLPNYKVNGTIIAVNETLTTPFNTNITSLAGKTAVNNIDTIATIIVPANLLDKIASDLKEQGFGFDNQFPFKSLRRGGSTAGDDKNQVMLVLSSSSKDLNGVISSLHIVIPTMPYI